MQMIRSQSTLCPLAPGCVRTSAKPTVCHLRQPQFLKFSDDLWHFVRGAPTKACDGNLVFLALVDFSDLLGRQTGIIFLLHPPAMYEKLFNTTKDAAILEKKQENFHTGTK